MATKKALLVVLDGFGIGQPSTHNAVQNSKMTFYHSLRRFPHSELLAHGENVGLPPSIMGNSEVGHMTLGAGKILFQDLTRISQSIRTQEFFQNPVLIDSLAHPRVHLIGLLSDGGVHSHIDHLMALLDLCEKKECQNKIQEVIVHPILDGRDTPPGSAPIYLTKLSQHPLFKKKKAFLGVIAGRFWAMDRDQRYERTESYYASLTGRTKILEKDWDTLFSLKAQSEEFLAPTLFNEKGIIEREDSVFIFNFRSDRARQLTQALFDPHFNSFSTPIQPKRVATLTAYDRTWSLPVAFPPQSICPVFGEWLEKNQRTQLRIAETEKYAHVTFFFNGGREEPFQGESRILIPSPKEVMTYDLKPGMSALAITDALVDHLENEESDFILVNYANADMVGHTGNYEATLMALQTLDDCLDRLITKALSKEYEILLTSDHGNAEEMLDPLGRPHTQHTLNPVPLIWISNSVHQSRLSNGGLSDVMPTLCELMNLEIPKETTGKSLIIREGA